MHTSLDRAHLYIGLWQIADISAYIYTHNIRLQSFIRWWFRCDFQSTCVSSFNSIHLCLLSVYLFVECYFHYKCLIKEQQYKFSSFSFSYVLQLYYFMLDIGITTTVGPGDKCEHTTCATNSECVIDACNMARCRCRLGYADSPDATRCWKRK